MGGGKSLYNPFDTLGHDIDIGITIDATMNDYTIYSLAGGDEQHVPVGVVLDDDQAVAGDGDEGLELGVCRAVLHHHGPGQRAPEAGVRREPRPHTQLLLGGEQS